MTIASFDIGSKYFAYVVGDSDGTLSAMKLVNVKGRTVNDTCENISSELTAREWTDCDTVLIEQQMASNVTAQRLGQHVWTWFRLMVPKARIYVVSASIKTPRALSYSQRKQYSTIEAKRLLITQPNWLGYLTSLSKQDDVSDAFMQLIAWSKSVKNLNNKCQNV